MGSSTGRQGANRVPEVQERLLEYPASEENAAQQQEGHDMTVVHNGHGKGTSNGRVPHNGVAKYKPLSSIWEGSDAELLEAMLNFYPSIKPSPILDATFNTGRIWKGTKRRITSMDIDPQYNTDIVGDNRVMDGVPSCKFGVVVYDPPTLALKGGTRA